MKKFLIHSIIFLAPFAVLLAPPFWIFARSGELTGLSRVIDLQKNSDSLVLFGQVYTDSRRDREYKIRSAVARKPEVIMMGTSRVLGYRSVFFKDPRVFYNAGRSIAVMNDLNIFLDAIPKEQTPAVIMVGLDQIFFFGDEKGETRETVEHPLSLFFKHNWRLLYSDYFNKKFTLTRVLSPPTELKAVGLNAVVNRKGFRNDGSYFYGDVIGKQDAEQKAIELKKRAVENLTPESCLNDYYGRIIRQSAIDELKRFLDSASSRGIAVIGFVSPYMPSLYATIQSRGGECVRAVAEHDLVTAEVFAKSGARFIDVTDLAKFGGYDAELFDTGHYSEKLSLRLFIAMAEQDEVLKNFVDLPYLREKLKKSTDNFTVFPQP